MQSPETNDSAPSSKALALLPPTKMRLGLRVAHSVWAHRHRLVAGFRRTGALIGWALSPLPERAKTISKELVFHAIEQLIVQSDVYQQWLQQRKGLGHLQHLLRPAREEAAPAALSPPSDAEWQEAISCFLTRPKQTEKVPVSVIIPVYRGYSETLLCLYSVMRSNNYTAYELRVVNDASPDALLSQKLAHLAQQAGFDYQHQTRNLGFVTTVNRAMEQATGQDVVLLNADTSVSDGWLDRLMAALYHRDDIASATPWSNNAELCSYPRIFHANHSPLEMDDAAFNRLLEQRKPSYAELPTAVGFCMAIRRSALDAVGLFDEERFGRGYGEENDWCLRAAELGWRHVLADHLFVRHRGSVSFAGEKKRQLQRSLKKLNARHPHYRQLVRQFRHEDPLLPLRREIDMLRVNHYCGDNQRMLVISHHLGGGTEKHITDLTGWLREEGVEVIRLSPDRDRAGHVRLWHPALPPLPNLSFDVEREPEMLSACCAALNLCLIQVHHLLGFPPAMLHWIMRYSRQHQVAYDVMLHDYYFACPSVNLLVEGEYFTRTPSDTACAEWAARHPSASGRTPLWLWRERHTQFFKAARRITTPSHDTSVRYQHFFPEASFLTLPHPESLPLKPLLARIRSQSDMLEVAIVGHLARHKGRDIVLKLAQDAAMRGLAIRFHLFGEVDQPAAFKKTGHVICHGRYEESQLYDLLAKHRCHLAFFPAVWPETYSYTLSQALHYGLFPACFDLGAPAERLRQLEWGCLLPVSLMQDARQLNDALLAMMPTPAPRQPMLRDKSDVYPLLWQDYLAMPESEYQQPITPDYKAKA